MFLPKLKNLLSAILIGSSLLFVSCDSSSELYKIKGQLSDVENQVVYLEQLKFTEAILLDSVKMDEKGSFTMNVPFKDEGLYSLRINDQQMMFVLDNSPITIEGNGSALEQAKVTGSKGSDILKGYNEKMNVFMANILTLNQQQEDLMIQGAGAEEFTALEKEQETQFDAVKAYLKSFVDTTTSQTVAIVSAANFLNDPNEISYLEDLNKSFDKRFNKRTEFGKEFSKLLSEKLIANEAQNKGNLKIGEKAPDFTLPKANGEMFSLSDYRGQYVLIDFWASWCAPCRKENPNVVKNYKQFKDQNFTVFGVSIDEDKAAWLKAVKDDQLTWEQVIDTDGWQSKAARLYNVSSIPSNFLVDPEGNIIATNLRGSELERELNRLINN